MKVNVNYDDFLTDDNKEIINNAELKVNDNISINLSKSTITTGTEIENVCSIIIKDSLAVSEIQTSLNKEDIREFLEILKRFYNQI